jgi:hypothetical protein
MLNVNTLVAEFIYVYDLSDRRKYIKERNASGQYHSCRYEAYNFLRIRGIHTRKIRRQFISKLHKTGFIGFNNAVTHKVKTKADIKALKALMRADAEAFTCVKDTTYKKSLVLFDNCTYEMNENMADKLDSFIYANDNVWFII